jgi:low affinity Fe/Cu permease
MNHIHRHTERGFEKVIAVATFILGHSITFILALCVVIFWFSSRAFYTQDIYDLVKDAMHGIIFLSLFIIQKSFNRFAASLHLKVNELVASHEPASNTVIHTEQITEHELNELSKEYESLAEIAKEEEIGGADLTKNG